jgi:hypothetical protein
LVKQSRTGIHLSAIRLVEVKPGMNFAMIHGMKIRNWILCIVLSLFLGSSSILYSQIVNIEKKRISDDSTGWFGTLNMNFSGAKSTKAILALSSGTLLEYKARNNKELWLLITDLSLISADKEKFSNSGFGHLRYNYKLGKAIRWELFTQIQYNSLTKINKRALLGTGPRFKLTQYENAKFYWGIAYMYEYEEVSDTTMLHHDHRLSSYFSFSLSPEETVNLSSTTYVQPLLKDWTDFRISTETNLSLNISKKLKFNSTFKYAFDSAPPSEVPRNTYSFTNGLELEF